MQNMASETSKKNKVILPIIGGVVILLLIIVIIVLSIGQREQTVSYESTLAEITNVAQTLTNEAVAMQDDLTATPTVMIQEATPTIIEPTSIPETATPEIESSDQNEVSIKFVCMDNNYDATIKDHSSFNSESASYRESEITDTVINTSIPVLSCMVEVEFPQPVSDDVYVGLYQARDTTAWYKRKLEPVNGMSNTYYAIVNHQYVIAPPYWNILYGLKIENVETVYWEGTLSLSRPFSGLCWEGSMPDPVTLSCPVGDRLEREPHPDMPTLVPGGLH